MKSPDDYSIEGYSRQITGIAYPRSVSELKEIVKEANGLGRPIFPISGGRNWGYGSRLPAVDHCLVVDLNQMNQICELNTEQGYAVIEPGVSQLQLYNSLKDTEFYFDVTGSSSQTSILGNILERGIGYQYQRSDLVNGFEVLLPDGEVIRTGTWGQQERGVSHLYSRGIGPNFTELFSQSNLGIVTKVSVRLLKRPEFECTFNLSLKDANLGEMIEDLKYLKEQNLIHGIPHIATSERFSSTTMPLIQKIIKEDNLKVDLDRMRKFIHEFDFYVVGKIHCTNGTAKSIKKSVHDRLKKYGRVIFLDKNETFLKSPLTKLFLSLEKRLLLKATRNLRGLSYGIPTDDGVYGAVWSSDSFEELQESDISAQRLGWILCTPVGFLCEKTARDFLKVSSEFSKKFNVDHAVTLNVLSGQVLEAVISLKFDKKRQAEEAKACLLSMEKEFYKLGYFPYRIGIESMNQWCDWSQNSWHFVSKLKQAIDPKNIFSPGRYQAMKN